MLTLVRGQYLQLDISNKIFQIRCGVVSYDNSWLREMVIYIPKIGLTSILLKSLEIVQDS